MQSDGGFGIPRSHSGDLPAILRSSRDRFPTRSMADGFAPRMAVDDEGRLVHDQRRAPCARRTVRLAGVFAALAYWMCSEAALLPRWHVWAGCVSSRANLATPLEDGSGLRRGVRRLLGPSDRGVHGNDRPGFAAARRGRLYGRDHVSRSGRPGCRRASCCWRGDPSPAWIACRSRRGGGPKPPG